MIQIPTFEPSADVVRAAVREFGSPLYLYDEATLRARARAVAGFGGPFGFTPRFALKANPCKAVLQLFAAEGLHFDASSVHEAARAVRAGIAPSRVQLTAQILGAGFDDLARSGVRLTACSLRQVERIGAALPGTEIGLRINPGEGSGHNKRTNVAGPNASFGVWHEQIPEACAIAARHGLRMRWMHHHVGSGGDPQRWAEIARITLGLLDRFPEVVRVNLGGGFKVARLPGEKESDLGVAAHEAHELLREVARASGRELHLEIEPGTWLTATTGAIVGTVYDVVSTGDGGHTFVKTDVGMAEILRPALYGAQHPLCFVPADASRAAAPAEPLLVVGPCCESGDILTPAPGDPEGLLHRSLPRPEAGDLVVVGGAGAYCASMPARNYNSFPGAPEVLREQGGALRLVRRRQTLDDVLRDEI